MTPRRLAIVWFDLLDDIELQKVSEPFTYYRGDLQNGGFDVIVIRHSTATEKILDSVKNKIASLPQSRFVLLLIHHNLLLDVVNVLGLSGIDDQVVGSTFGFAHDQLKKYIQVEFPLLELNRIWIMPMFVEQIMIHNPIDLEIGASLLMAYEIMRASRIGHLPIVDPHANRKLLGLLSWSRLADLIPLEEGVPVSDRVVEIKRLAQLKVDDRMVPLSQLSTATKRQSIQQLLKTFVTLTAEGKYPSVLPVVDKTGVARGIISWIDVFREWPRIMSKANSTTDLHAGQIGSEINSIPHIPSNVSVQAATAIVQRGAIPYVRVLDERTEKLVKLLSNRDLLQYSLTAHMQASHDGIIYLANLPVGKVNPKHSLAAITIPATLNLWQDKGDSIIKRFVESVAGNKAYSERIGALLSQDGESGYKTLITPVDCIRAVISPSSNL